ncbi:DUF2254 domain-containing protein [Alkalihalobacillus sp. AL-G]|uniref:DUF2254 domain-containing protein n=1 Tax=Alkalihalobacillus sp. AL-G TaxID=2926399 RepID=UPI00272D3B51|nr:DUF2254 domain-containing protein [Alkalihalobacillus sp. AL-G]WLD94160.1 DUF2254 domain-containing protein [Alkalihalobacillus sp. AL-G]
MSPKNWLHKIYHSFWYQPAAYSILAVLSAFLSVEADMWMERVQLYQMIPSFLMTDRDTSRLILSALATSILTMTAITFSSIMVLLSTYLSQYSPRTLDNFLSDPVTRRVLGVFIGSFFYFLLLLVWMNISDQARFFFVPSLSILMAALCLGFFVYFIHHVGTWIQVNNLIQNITDNCLGILERNELHHSNLTSSGSSPWSNWEEDELKLKESKSVTSVQSGYIQNIDLEALIQLAKRDDLLLKMDRNIGDYVDNGSPLFSYWSLGDRSFTIDTYIDTIRIGERRTTEQDLEFGIQKLTEIALRAISPAVNDPYTAIISIHKLGRVLSRLAQTFAEEPYFYDDEKNLRVIIKQDTFSYVLYKSFYQLRHYGRQDVSVLAAMVEALSLIAENNESIQVKNTLWQFVKAVCEGTDRSMLITMDVHYLNGKIDELARLTGHSKEKQLL